MMTLKIHPEERLIRFRAPDGFLITSHLVMGNSIASEALCKVPILIEVHGLLGHFLARGTPRILPHALLDRGFSSFSINTRLAFSGQMNGKGIFNDTIYDIDAAVSFLTKEGFKNIFILGYSLGASMVLYWAGNRADPDIRGLILEGAHYSIPDSQRKRLAKWGSTPTYDELYERAKEVLGNDPYHSLNDEMVVIYRARGPSRKPLHDEIFTYKTWWHMMGPEAHAAMAYKQIGKVKVPLLLIRGENDPLIEDWEAPALARIAKEANNKQVMVREIPQAGHDCMENRQVMLKEIVSMFSQYTKS